MRIERMFPSQWLSGLDLNGRNVTVTIESLTSEKVGAPPKQEEKYILSFQGKDKRLILNKTNAEMIARQHGPETDNWMGKPITLYCAKVDAFGQVHDAIRVRPQVKTVSAAPDPITPADADDVFDDDPDPIAAPPETSSLPPENGVGEEDSTVSRSVWTNYHELGTALHGEEWDNVRHEQTRVISNGSAESSKELTMAQLKRLTAGMAARLAQKNQPDAALSNAEDIPF